MGVMDSGYPTLASTEIYGSPGYRKMAAEAQNKEPLRPPQATGEAIAKVVSDLRRRRVVSHPDRRLTEMSLDTVMQADAVVVDSTPLYLQAAEAQKNVFLYEDHPNIAPPWDHALICYVNEHGNVLVMDTVVLSHDGSQAWPIRDRDRVGDPPVEWDRVKWIYDTVLWLGGHGGDGIRLGTHGPMHGWRSAVYEDGEPADLSWVRFLEDYPMELWDMAHCVLLDTLNFMNCRNIELVEPHRDRGERRRIAHTGVSVKTLNVFPAGKTTRSENGERTGGAPLTSVRGHFASYGEKYGRGKLFGKFEGRFWIPQHARGDTENGEVKKSYRPVP